MTGRKTEGEGGGIRGRTRRMIEGEEGEGIIEEKGEEGEKKREAEEERIKIVFWNVAGLGNKGKDFWKEIREWDIIVMSETWMEEKGWRKVRGNLPRGYR